MTDSSINVFTTRDHPESIHRVQEIIALWRMVLAPMLNADVENLPMHQSHMISAAGLFAGMTVGHIISVGTMLPQDKRRASQVVLQCFQEGIKLGEAEAAKAIAELPKEAFQ